MNRLPDWRSRLEGFLAAHARRAYRPGRHDCITFASDARKALTGLDLMAQHRGRYHSVEAGLEIARSLGFEDHVAFVTQDLSAIPPAFAQVGDLAELEGVDGLAAMGVVGGSHIYALSPRGWGIVPLTTAVGAWRV